MAKTREIKKRIKAVGNIRRITKTMQMIATSKFARAQQRATATKPYTEGVFELVRQIGAAGSAGGAEGEGASHPLLSGPQTSSKSVQKHLTLVITSDRGLCGPYNGAVLRTAMAHLRSDPKFKPAGAGGGAGSGVGGGEVELVGKKGAGFMKYAGIALAKQHAFGDKPEFRTIETLAQSYMDRFIAGEITSVNVVFMRYISAGRQRPEVLQLLPLKPSATPASAKAGSEVAAAKSAVASFEFSPPAPQLLNALLPAAVKATLFQIFNDAIVSEHVARMIAMKAATDNAGKMGKSLTRRYNRARQAQITTELTEIISGAAALG